MKPERIENLSPVDRWFRDGLKAIDPPGGFLTVEVDMHRAAILRAGAEARGARVTYTHIIVAAVAAALTRNPDLHRLNAGNKRLIPQTVDVCLSIAGEGAITPVLILRDAGRRDLDSIAMEIRDRTAEARREDEKRLRMINRWGWIVPGSWLRTSLIRFLLNQIWYRRRASGTFQVTVVSNVDLAVPFLFNTAAALGAGRVRDRVVAIDGRIAIRPTLILSCCCDHKVWSGMDTARFLNAVKAELEELPPE
jgi:pyruvate dehydrogenase E2 component (dihydrolipoamide acetyltransferase)